MDLNVALVALVFWVGLSLGLAAFLDGRQSSSRSIPIVRPQYHPAPRDRRHPFR
jgi:hypothetical protein